MKLKLSRAEREFFRKTGEQGGRTAAARMSKAARVRRATKASKAAAAKRRKAVSKKGRKAS